MYATLQFPSSLFVVGRNQASTRSGFPAINVGNTPTTIEIEAFAPGLDPARIDIAIERGVLTLSGERASSLPSTEEARDRKLTVSTAERGHGSFRREVRLPDDADASQVNATYRDGVLAIRIARRESAQPRRIAVQ